MSAKSKTTTNHHAEDKLGDFTMTSRVLTISGLAILIGAEVDAALERLPARSPAAVGPPAQGQPSREVTSTTGTTGPAPSRDGESPSTPSDQAVP